MISTRPILSREHSQRLHLRVQGMIQGLGFRPFVYRLATALGLNGWVCNSDSGVEIEVEGEQDKLAAFLDRLERHHPPHAILSTLETNWLPPYGYDRFEIHASESDGRAKSAWILPDLATCTDCLRELFEPANRRYQYPFTNCTHCGPRYSILTALPYDRLHTTMQDFRLCPGCQQEYHNPTDRRFHAQPNACPECGPQLELWDAQGRVLQSGAGAALIQLAADRIRQGQIIALKGLGGFHLVVDARSEAAVSRLRDRKHRPAKPLAVMYPSLDVLRQDCRLSPVEAELLTSAMAPIVLLTPRRNPNSSLANSVAPHQSTLGVMLPYTPLHHLLLAELSFPVVATSGNRSQAPICIDNGEAVDHLSPIADAFLVHNRPIARPVDDSVVRVMGDRPMLLRRARGYAPFPISSGVSGNAPCLLALGGHLKNTVALAVQGRIVISQHLGDLNQVQTAQRFQETITQMLQLYNANPIAIACDAHPDYTSTHASQHLSQQRGIPVLPIQHHYAHVLSGMVDQALEPPVLGIAWDGVGYGLDGALWGGEFLAISNRKGFERVAHLRPFPLPGGDLAAREPRRAALGLLYAAFGDRVFELDIPVRQAFQVQELKLLRTLLQRQVNTPHTSSIGRLFDAIAALINLCQASSFEGEAAMRLESVTAGGNTTQLYPYSLVRQDNGLIVDWEPMLTAILADLHEPVGIISVKFHNTLIEVIVAISRQVGIPQVVLTGGCFQNRYLLAGAIRRLRAAGFQSYWHQQIPPNDGGLSVGQIIGAAWRLEQTTSGGMSCV